MSNWKYVTHARTLEELRQEFLSDIQRRLAAIQMEQKTELRPTAAKALARASRELDFLLSFWQEVTLGAAKRPKKERQT